MPSSAFNEANLLYTGLTVLSLLGNAILIWWKLTGRKETHEITPQPLKVQAATEFVTAEHCALLHRNFEDRLTTLEKNTKELFRLQRESYNEIMRSAAEARARMHEKIDGVAQSIAHIEGTMEPFKGLVERLSRDIGRIEGVLQRKS